MPFLFLRYLIIILYQLMDQFKLDIERASKAIRDSRFVEALSFRV